VVEEWRDRFPSGVEKRFAGAAKVGGALCEEEINQLKRTAPRSLEFHFDDESDLAEFPLVFRFSL